MHVLRDTTSKYSLPSILTRNPTNIVNYYMNYSIQQYKHTKEDFVFVNNHVRLGAFRRTRLYVARTVTM